MPDELIPARSISIRLPAQLATDLRRAATREQNPDSAVARRLIAEGLRVELARPTPEGEAA